MEIDDYYGVAGYLSGFMGSMLLGGEISDVGKAGNAAESATTVSQLGDDAARVAANYSDDAARVVAESSDDVARVAAESAQYGDDFGKMGKYVENPGIKVDWSQYAEHGAERMAQRGMSHEMIDSIVENGRTLSQSGGKKFAYISQEGVAVVSKDGKLITAWGKADFDENMLDIVEKLFGR